jgi:hypothetical protein
LNDKVAQSESPPPRAIRWPRAVVTVLVGVVAVGLVVVQLVWAAQFARAQSDPASPKNQAILGNQLSLSLLDDRATKLEADTNWNDHCIGLAAMGRELDAALAPGARVFVPEMLGPTNLPKAGYYYFMKNYLFPREVAISLDGKSTGTSDGFYGIPCDSPEVLRSNGFDVIIDFTDRGPRVTPLTPKAFRANE